MKANRQSTETNDNELLLAEIAMEAHLRFGHRHDEERLVQSAVEIARLMLACRPVETHFVAEIAIATICSPNVGCRLAA